VGSQPRGISGSRAAAILGLGEYEGQTVFTAWQLICEERRPGFNASRGYILPPPVDNPAVRWGSAFEDAIVELAGAKRGQNIRYRERLYWVDFNGESKTGSAMLGPYDPITCHIDGRYADGVLHEGKTTNLWSFRELWGPPGTDRVPQTYQVQTQHQMLCTGATECIVSVLVFPRRTDEWEAEGWSLKAARWESDGPDGPVNHWLEKEGMRPVSPSSWARVMAEMGLFHQYPVPASPSLQAMLIDGYRHFWDHYVLPEREPEIDCYADLRRAFHAPVGTLVVTEQEESWLSEYRMIGEEISPSGRLGRRREELKTLVLKSARSRSGSAVPDEESGDKLIFRDSTGRKVGSFDGKTFR